jgi:hypothetical protein
MKCRLAGERIWLERAAGMRPAVLKFQTTITGVGPGDDDLPMAGFRRPENYTVATLPYLR